VVFFVPRRAFRSSSSCRFQLPTPSLHCSLSSVIYSAVCNIEKFISGAKRLSDLIPPLTTERAQCAFVVVVVVVVVAAAGTGDCLLLYGCAITFVTDAAINVAPVYLHRK